MQYVWRWRILNLQQSFADIMATETLTLNGSEHLVSFHGPIVTYFEWLFVYVDYLVLLCFHHSHSLYSTVGLIGSVLFYLFVEKFYWLKLHLSVEVSLTCDDDDMLAHKLTASNIYFYRTTRICVLVL
jgi:hypothetical protein